MQPMLQLFGKVVLTVAAIDLGFKAAKAIAIVSEDAATIMNLRYRKHADRLIEGARK